MEMKGRIAIQFLCLCPWALAKHRSAAAGSYQSHKARTLRVQKGLVLVLLLLLPTSFTLSYAVQSLLPWHKPWFH
jgi:hypothetical protein